LVLDLLLAADI
jgi:hypothetical protein